MDRKAQIKMFETLAVLVVFFFFLIFGASFYFKLQENSLERDFARNLDLRAVQIAQKSITLPELRCTFPYAERSDCIDFDKAREFKKLLDDNPNIRLSYLDNTFGLSSITLNVVYSSVGISEDKIVIYNASRSEEFVSVQIPTVIYSGSDHRRALSFGYLEVTVDG